MASLTKRIIQRWSEETGFPPEIIIALTKNRTKQLGELLVEPLNINTVTPPGHNLLSAYFHIQHQLKQKANPAFLRFLLNAGIDIEFRDVNRATGFDLIKNTDARFLPLLLDRREGNPDDIEAEPPHRSNLMIAVQAGHHDVVGRYLLRAENLAYRDDEGKTYLDYVNDEAMEQIIAGESAYDYSTYPKLYLKFREQYEVIRTLGSGHIGLVYLVFDRDDQTQKALKIIDFRREEANSNELDEYFLTKLADCSAVPSFYARFTVGAADLPPHQWPAKEYYDAIVISYIEAIEFRQWLPADYEEVKTVLTNIFRILAEFQRRGIYHQDIKEANNILILPDLSVKLIDFGQACDGVKYPCPVNVGQDTLEFLIHYAGEWANAEYQEYMESLLEEQPDQFDFAHLIQLLDYPNPNFPEQLASHIQEIENPVY